MTQQKAKYRLSDMALDFVSLVAAGDDPMAQVVIAKAAPEKNADDVIKPPTIPLNDLLEDNMGEPIAKDDLAPEVVAYIDGLESEVETLSAQVEKSVADIAERDEQISKMVPKDAEAEGEISKALLAKADPAVRSLIEKQQAEIAKANEIARAERDARLDREFISKAEALPMVAEDKTALAGLLRRASEALSPEDNTALTTVLKAANEQIAKGNLFTTFGTGGGETTISKSVRAAAEEIRKANPALTIEQAEAQVYATQPALFQMAMTNDGQEG